MVNLSQKNIRMIAYKIANATIANIEHTSIFTFAFILEILSERIKKQNWIVHITFPYLLQALFSQHKADLAICVPVDGYLTNTTKSFLPIFRTYFAISFTHTFSPS